MARLVMRARSFVVTRRGTPDRLENLDSNRMGRRRSQPSIAGQQRGSKSLCECNVGGIIGREVIPELPHVRKKSGMRMTRDAKIQQVLNRVVRPTRRQDPLVNQAPEHVKHFDIEEMRSVKRLRLQTDSLVNALSRRRPQQPLHHCRGIQDNQRRSRSSRRMRTESIGTITGSLLSSRANISGIVGRSAISLISPSR